MTDIAAPGAAVRTGPPPPIWTGVLSGVVVVLAFTVAHDLWISDIWFNVGPMVFAGALCGFAITWSYRSVVAMHSPGSWLAYNGLFVGEMIALGAVSLLVLQPRWTMAELLVADDAFERLLPPSIPLIVGAMVVGTLGIWLGYRRPATALVPISMAQVLLVFLLGHQFAFLGLVETSTAVLIAFGQFALITVGIAGAFALGVARSASAAHRLRDRRHP